MVLMVQDILDGTRVGPGQVAAFVELHIEQGPLLEREGVQIGVVMAIAAPASFRVQFNGDGGHAGALLMPDRSAPLLVHWWRSGCLSVVTSFCRGSFSCRLSVAASSADYAGTYTACGAWQLVQTGRHM